VFEKSRGVGGRASTRRSGGWRFDHGAQYFTARNPRFADRVKSWQRRGAVAAWRGRIVEVRADGALVPKEGTSRYVGVPGMSQLARDLASGVKVVANTRVDGIRRRGGSQWQLNSGASVLGGFDAVVSSAPAPQAAELLREAAPALAKECDAVEALPTWAVMAAFSAPLPLGFDAAFVENSPLAWVARNSSKPMREESRESWVLHADATWSSAHLEVLKDDVARWLLEAFSDLVGRPGLRPVELEAHRWRYARSREPRCDGCLSDSDAPLVVCGDWLSGDRIEGAFLSGLAAAEKLADVFLPGRRTLGQTAVGDQ
jgi:predicted NAD/FAD-dependent oxidoreductase